MKALSLPWEQVSKMSSLQLPRKERNWASQHFPNCPFAFHLPLFTKHSLSFTDAHRHSVFVQCCGFDWHILTYFASFSFHSLPVTTLGILVMKLLTVLMGTPSVSSWMRVTMSSICAEADNRERDTVNEQSLIKLEYSPCVIIFCKKKKHYLL